MDEHGHLLAGLCRAACLANEAVLARHNDGTWTGHGDSVDLALLTMAHKAGGIQQECLHDWPQVATIACNVAVISSLLPVMESTMRRPCEPPRFGVAMGDRGTDVARETADIILTDDNFASIAAGIEEGRIAYANIRKVIFLLISTGGAEIVLFLIALVVNLPLPLLAVQLLWLNLVTNGIQ